MILYCDASGLIKTYLTEAHTESVRGWMAEADVVATHAVAYVEARSALARRRREGQLSAAQHDQIMMLLDVDWPAFALVSMDERLAGELAARHGLRALDAVHVAAALTLRDAAPAVTVAFCSFDQRQQTAARAEGLVALAPSDEGTAG